VGLGAFLLFLLQPLAARALLPSFGGTPTVWAVSLACYQTFLFVGYLAAHLIRTRTTPRVQGLVLTGALAAAAATLPLLPVSAMGEGDSVLAVALAVTVGVGPLFTALAAVGPLVQSWAGISGGDRAYRLYAVSNAASLGALLLFPTFFERLVDLSVLGRVWSWLFAVEIVLIGALALGLRRGPGRSPVVDVEDGEAEPSGFAILVWAAWAAAGVIVLNAVTTYLAQDLSSMPMLWVAPLSLYLITWVIAFSGRSVVSRLNPAVLAGVALGMLLPVMRGIGSGLLTTTLLSLGAMTAACLAAHTRLYALRPRAGRLTVFYLAIAAGGAVGGLFSGLAAPYLGPRWTELAVGFGAVALLSTVAGFRIGIPRGANAAAAVVLTAMVALLVVEVAETPAGTVYRHRDVYGLLTVAEQDFGDPDRDRLVMTHGATTHGAQFTAPARRGTPTTYFARTTGCGIAEAAQRARSGPTLKVGVVGLGAGTLAAYGRPGDDFVFYELSPAVIAVAQGGSDPAFTYLADTPARVEVVAGDARLSLASELVDDPAGRGFDLMVLDAFSGDGVPLHLLTREAFDVYGSHLAADAMIAVHVSSNWINLRPVLYAWARAEGWRALTVSNRSLGADDLTMISTWVLLFHDLEGLRVLRDQCLPLMERGLVEVENMNDVEFGGLAPWTDERGGLLDALTTKVVPRVH